MSLSNPPSPRSPKVKHQSHKSASSFYRNPLPTVTASFQNLKRPSSTGPGVMTKFLRSISTPSSTDLPKTSPVSPGSPGPRSPSAVPTYPPSPNTPKNGERRNSRILGLGLRSRMSTISHDGLEANEKAYKEYQPDPNIVTTPGLRTPVEISEQPQQYLYHDPPQLQPQPQLQEKDQEQTAQQQHHHHHHHIHHAAELKPADPPWNQETGGAVRTSTDHSEPAYDLNSDLSPEQLKAIASSLLQHNAALKATLHTERQSHARAIQLYESLAASESALRTEREQYIQEISRLDSMLSQERAKMRGLAAELDTTRRTYGSQNLTLERKLNALETKLDLESERSLIQDFESLFYNVENFCVQWARAGNSGAPVKDFRLTTQLWGAFRAAVPAAQTLDGGGGGGGGSSNSGDGRKEVEMWVITKSNKLALLQAYIVGELVSRIFQNTLPTHAEEDVCYPSHNRSSSPISSPGSSPNCSPISATRTKDLFLPSPRTASDLTRLESDLLASGILSPLSPLSLLFTLLPGLPTEDYNKWRAMTLRCLSSRTPAIRSPADLPERSVKLADELFILVEVLLGAFGERRRFGKEEAERMREEWRGDVFTPAVRLALGLRRQVATILVRHPAGVGSGGDGGGGEGVRLTTRPCLVRCSDEHGRRAEAELVLVEGTTVEIGRPQMVKANAEGDEKPTGAGTGIGTGVL